MINGVEIGLKTKGTRLLSIHLTGYKWIVRIHLRGTVSPAEHQCKEPVS